VGQIVNGELEVRSFEGSCDLIYGSNPALSWKD
jgi:hypothetical protein